MFVLVSVLLVAIIGASTLAFYRPSNPNPVSTICTINVEGDLVFKVVNSSTGLPISDVPVQVQNLYPLCPPNAHTTSNLGTLKTDANGTLVVGGLGEFYLHVNYGGEFSVNASVGPVRATCVTLEIPSGAVNTTYSQSFASSC